MSGTFQGVLASRPGLSAVMVGRGSELARLRSGVRDSGASAPVVLVSGEAGVGKTRLLVELAASLSAEARFFAAQAEPTAMGRPFQLLQDAVAPEVGTWTAVPPPLEPIEEAIRVLLGPVARGMSGGASPLDESRAYGSDELLAAAVELLRHIVAGGRGVMVFEDLHWADPDSLAAFVRLASSEIDLVMIGSYRPEALDRRHVTDLLASVERQCRVEHVALDRLSIEQAGELLAAVRGQPVAHEVTAAVHRRTGGNPFFIEELLLAAGDAPVEVVSDLPLPVTLTEAVVRRLDGLGPAQRRVVDAASVLGQHIPFDLLCSLTGVAEDDMVDVLRTLVDNGLLVEDSPDVFSFRHALTREAVAGRLGRERRRLHEKAFAELIATGSDDWGALAHHAAGAGRHEDMVDAARRGALHYLHSGATYQALWLAELGVAEADADMELLELSTQAAWAVGLLTTAVERAEKWRHLAEAAGSPVDLCRALRVLARLRWEADDREAHAAALTDARAASELLPVGEERAWVVNLAAEAAYLNSLHQQAIGLADEALAVAGPNPSSGLRAAVLVNRGSAMLGVRGMEAQGAELLEDAVHHAVAAGDHLSALRGLNNLLSYLSSWDLPRCLVLLGQMDDLVARSGRRDWAGTARMWRAVVLAWVAGDSVAALATLESGTEDDFPKRSGAWLLRAELAIEIGDARTAERALETIGNRPEDAANHAALRLLRAAATGGREDVSGLATEVAGLVSAATLRQLHDCGNIAANALSEALRRGAPFEAADTALEVLDAYQGGTHWLDPGWVLHLRAARCEAAGDLEGAVDGFGAAVGIEGLRRPPHALGSAHLATARLLLAADPAATDEARRHAQRAVSLLERWPGFRHDDAVALLGRLRPRGRPQPGGALTDREEEVAVLVAEGLTNGEIAARLYLSPKTASVHVSNILRKLGMSSRAEVAAWVARGDH